MPRRHRIAAPLPVVLSSLTVAGHATPAGLLPDQSMRAVAPPHSKQTWACVYKSSLRKQLSSHIWARAHRHPECSRVCWSVHDCCLTLPWVAPLQRPQARRVGAMQGGGLGNPAAATITFLGGAAGAGGTDTAGGFGGSSAQSCDTRVLSPSCEFETSGGIYRCLCDMAPKQGPR